MTENNWIGKAILIVEDNIINFKYLELALKSTQVHIIHATTGQEALEYCSQNIPIDLILMDINLPEMTGYEATERIRLIHPTIPIIAQTGNEAKSDLQRCFDAGCNDFLTKPIIADVLIDKIKEYF